MIAIETSISQASATVECPLCAERRYCGLVKNGEGEIYKVICQWADPNLPPQGWKHTGTAKDGRHIFTQTNSIYKRRKNKKYPAEVRLYPQVREEIPTYQDYTIPLKELSKGNIV